MFVISWVFGWTTGGF